MARTDAGTTLTQQHRQIQLAVRAQALRDFTQLWPLWQPGDDSSFGALVQATMPLVRVYHGLSSAAATSYYGAFRTAEEIDGAATPRRAPEIVDAQVTTSLYVTGKVMAAKARAAGKTPEQARQDALVRTAGTVTRHVLDGGRQALIDSVAADPRARGWARVTDDDPCYFCLTLASRGPVYKSEQAADFAAHDHCGCTVEPIYDGSAWPGRAREYRNIYEAAQQFGLNEGLLQPGENPSAARLNAVRRYLAAQ